MGKPGKTSEPGEMEHHWRNVITLNLTVCYWKWHTYSRFAYSKIVIFQSKLLVYQRVRCLLAGETMTFFAVTSWDNIQNDEGMGSCILEIPEWWQYMCIYICVCMCMCMWMCVCRVPVGSAIVDGDILARRFTTSWPPFDVMLKSQVPVWWGETLATWPRLSRGGCWRNLLRDLELYEACSKYSSMCCSEDIWLDKLDPLQKSQGGLLHLPPLLLYNNHHQLLMTLLVACLSPSWSYHHYHHHHHQPHSCRHLAWDPIRQDTKPLVKWIALLKIAGFELLLMDPWSTKPESHDSFIGGLWFIWNQERMVHRMMQN